MHDRPGVPGRADERCRSLRWCGWSATCRSPVHYRVAVNRRTVFARDGSRCQYCGSAAENLDHVIPRSKGGPHTWENVVAACRRCNTRKEDRLPHEAGMVLRCTPVAPRHRVQLLALCGGAGEEWGTYLGSPLSDRGQLTA
jgi:5-methylcytosine-specific restriction endonuclease McrA